MDQWRSKFSESFSLDRYWSIECSSLCKNRVLIMYTYLFSEAFLGLLQLLQGIWGGIDFGNGPLLENSLSKSWPEGLRHTN